MKNLKWILLSVWAFTSCIDTEFQRQYVSDLVLVTKAINGDTVFAIDGYISTNDNADSVRVTGKTFLGFNKLFKAYEGNSKFFEYSTPDSAYSKIVPVTSDYTFTIYHSDQTVEYQYDRLSTLSLKPATIDSVRFDTKFDQVDLYWRKVDGAESYMVQFFRNGEIVYRSPNLIPSLRLFSVNQSSSVQWYKTVEKGDTLQVRLVAIAFEDEYKASDNYQAMSFSGFSDIVWGVKK
jgi:hypothetical protein